MKKLLFVDSSKISRLIAKAFLKKEGFEVTDIEGGRPAIDILRNRHDYDIIVTAYDLPDMEGPELVQSIRRIKGESEIPIILWRARDEELEVLVAMGKSSWEMQASSTWHVYQDLLKVIKEVFS